MRSGWIGVALICVMSIFLFPVGNGPFSATHGPATAFRAKQSAALLLLSLCILLVGILTVACRAIRSLCDVPVAALSLPSATPNSGASTVTRVLLC
jgi:hypothetical protein